MSDLAPAGRKLKKLRERVAISVQEMADHLDMPKSTYSSKETKSKRRYLDPELLEAVFPILVQRGISRDEIMALGGPARDDFLSPMLTTDKGTSAPDDGTAARRPMAHIAESDARGAAGAGAVVEAERTVSEWSMPRDFLRVATYAPDTRVRIITVVGDSMPDTFRAFDKVLVDTTDTTPTPPGIFVVWDGLGLVVKRVEHIAHSDPPTVRIMSDNPKYPTYERTLGEAYIQGRVLGKWQWI